jgi:hypothetical protein
MPDIAGLKLIVPTSVAGSGVSVSASGKVTFTATTTVNVNGCFTSTYDNYLVVMRGSTDAGRTMRMRLRASGTDATGTNYTIQSLSADSTTVSGARTTSSDFALAVVLDSAAKGGSHFYFYGPNLAQPTAARSVTASNTSSARISDYAWTHSLSTAYDGFTFYSGGTEVVTGALTIYGLSQ